MKPVKTWRTYRKASDAADEPLPLWDRAEIDLPRPPKPTPAQIAESERRAERRFSSEPMPLTVYGDTL